MIRKLMVAVTVLGLVGSGTFAQEEPETINGLTFKGTAGLGVKYTGDMENDAGETTMKSTIAWISDFDLAMSASGTTDGGLTFGASAKVKAGHAGPGEVGQSTVFIGGESWKISIGDVGAASDEGLALGDVGFDGLGVEDVAVDELETPDGDVKLSFSLGTASLAITVDQEPGMAAVDGNNDGDVGDAGEAATKQTTEWAAGVGFDIGSASLGLGMDSKKLLAVSIGADLGAFNGKLFYGQRKEKTIEVSDDSTVNNKITGIGAEITVSAGVNTKINAVYAQGKHSDTRTANADGSALVGGDSAQAKTDKGFGVGVTHDLGGGATLNAGFAKVKKVTKASAGVSMSF